MKCSKSRGVQGFLVREAMSLDVMEFLKEDFFYKYEKLQSYGNMIDAPLRRLFYEYHSQLQDIDIASLQGADPDLLYILNCAVDDCLVESAESLHSMAKRSFRSCRKRKGLGMKKTLEDNLKNLKSAISKRCGSSVSAPHKAASIPLLNYKVHGFEVQFEKIVKKISAASDHGSCAVGIVGIGGSGKTTLASMVFNAREVREKYQIMIWASLTSTLNKKESTRGSVFMEILSGVQNNDSLKTMLQKIKSYQDGAKIADRVLDKYIDHFKEALKRNSGKYLLVLDDVWETEYWFAEKEDLKFGEPKCIMSLEWIQKTGGTIMVTSRLEEMADNIVGKRDLYMISPVSEDACFEIFLDRVTKDGKFTREDERLKSLKKKEIADKCFGLPLAACTVADIFVTEEAEKPGMQKKEDVKDKIEAEGEGDTSKPKAEAEGSSAKDKIEAEGEGDTSKPKTEVEGEGDTLEADEEGEGSSPKGKIEAEGEGDTSEPKTEVEGEGDTSEADEEGEGSSPKGKIEAEGEGDTSKPKAEAEGTKDKIEAEGEGDTSKPKAEAEDEGSAAKDKTEAEGEGYASKPRAEEDKIEAEPEVEGEASAAKDKTGADVLVPKVKAKGEADQKAELAAEDAKADARVKETAPESSKADIAPPRRLARRMMKAFRKAKETKKEDK